MSYAHKTKERFITHKVTRSHTAAYTSFRHRSRGAASRHTTAPVSHRSSLCPHCDTHFQSRCMVAAFINIYTRVYYFHKNALTNVLAFANDEPRKASRFRSVCASVRA